MNKHLKSPSEAERLWELQPWGTFLRCLQCPQRYLLVSNFCALGLDSGSHSPILVVWLK